MNLKTQQNLQGVYWGKGAKGGIGVDQPGTEMERERERGRRMKGKEGRRRGKQVGGALLNGKACTCLESLMQPRMT